MSGVVVVIIREFFGYGNSFAAFSPNMIFFGIITFQAIWVRDRPLGVLCFTRSRWNFRDYTCSLKKDCSRRFSSFIRFNIPIPVNSSIDFAIIPAASTSSGWLLGESGGGNMIA